MFTKNNVISVPVVSIDINNNDFKLSKPVNDSALRESLLFQGLLEPPVLLKNKDKHIIISGHNRIGILAEENHEYVRAEIAESFEPDMFISIAYLKNYRNEIGPAGKIKFLNIIKKHFKAGNELSDIIKRMNIPFEAAESFSPWDRFNDLPEKLKEYADSKDISYKIIKSLLLMDLKGIKLLTNWLTLDMRVNIFRGIIELMSDIFRRDKSFDEMEKIDIGAIKDKRRRETELYKSLYELRYPEYSGLKLKADKIIQQFNKEKIDIIFPEFFENDEIGVMFKLKKREGVNAFRERIKNTNFDSLDELLNIL